MGIAAAAGIAGIAAAGTTIGSTIAGAASGSKASQQAANVSQQAAQTAQGNAAPFYGAGQTAVENLNSLMNNYGLGAPMDLSAMPMFNWNPTEAGLQQTPGYQFTLQQGLQGVQNAAAARGLGVSGAAMKGAADYTTGLADKTYTQQLNNYIAQYGQQMNQFQNTFQDYWANQNNRYNQLYNLSQLGANAALGAATNQTTAAANIGNYMQTAGQTTGSAIQGVGTTVSSALNNPFVQNYLTGSGGSTYDTGGAAKSSTVAQDYTTPSYDTGWQTA